MGGTDLSLLPHRRWLQTHITLSMKKEFLPKTKEGRLARLAEEAIELAKELLDVAKEVQKITRFGADTVCPDNCGVDSGTTPRARLVEALNRVEPELADFRHAFTECINEGDFV